MKPLLYFYFEQHEIMFAKLTEMTTDIFFLFKIYSL